MKILHLASFEGNIGDLLSHEGTYSVLKSIMGNEQPIIEKLELRSFYKNSGLKRNYFNEALADYFNKFDLIIIGGGGYLKQLFPDSISGNTFDFERGFLNKLKTRVLFFSIGGLASLDQVSEIAYRKTEVMLKNLLYDERFLFLFRSDGSVENSRVLSEIHTQQPEQFEIGFDAAYLNPLHFSKENSDFVLINIGYDQVLQNSQLDIVVKKMREIIVALSSQNPSLMFCFLPHILDDIKVFSEIADGLPPLLARSRLKCLETCISFNEIEYAKRLYQGASLCLTGRFHSAAFATLYSKKFLPVYDFQRVRYQMAEIFPGDVQFADKDTALLMLKSQSSDESYHCKIFDNKIRVTKFLARALAQ